MASFSAEFSDTSSMEGPRARADGTASDYCPLQWWKLNSLHLPMWSKVAIFTYYSSIIPDARIPKIMPA